MRARGTRDPAGAIKDADGGAALRATAVQAAMPAASSGDELAAAASAGIVGLDYYGKVPSEAAEQTADVYMMRPRST